MSIVVLSIAYRGLRNLNLCPGASPWRRSPVPRRTATRTFSAAADSSCWTAWIWAPASSRMVQVLGVHEQPLLDFPERILPSDFGVKASEELDLGGEALTVAVTVHLADFFSYRCLGMKWKSCEKMVLYCMIQGFVLKLRCLAIP